MEKTMLGRLKETAQQLILDDIVSIDEIDQIDLSKIAEELGDVKELIYDNLYLYETIKGLCLEVREVMEEGKIVNVEEFLMSGEESTKLNLDTLAKLIDTASAQAMVCGREPVIGHGTEMTEIWKSFSILNALLLRMDGVYNIIEELGI